jgi:hypothetical protein
MHSTLENVNYHNDRRVLALGKEAWYIGLDNEKGPTEAVVRVPTADYQLLADAGYDPEDFEAGGRPVISMERQPIDKPCQKCKGHRVMYRHKEWQGVTLRADGTPTDPMWANYQSEFETSPENFRKEKCNDSWCIDGKSSVLVRLDEEKPDPDMEDREYRPFRKMVLPVKRVPCETCGGKGTHVNPSVDAGGISSREFDEDPGFRDNYFSGVFDVRCYSCNGGGHDIAVVESAIHPDDKPMYDAWLTWRNEMAADEAAHHAERMAEIRMGC